MINLEEAVVRKLKTTQYLLSTIESCTGGLIAHLITNVPGVSEVYWGSSIVYDNSVKQELGVSEEILTAFGAVSRQVAHDLAELGLKKMQNNPFRARSQSLLKPRGFVCIATTGIAGPSGGSREKPVGLCFIGLAISGRQTIVEEFRTGSKLNRTQIKNQFAQKALEMIRENI